MAQIAPQTLDLVGRELGDTLNEARAALEAYVDQTDNISLLQRSAAELHRVQGVLRVLEIYGAALLAEEMEQVAAYLVATVGERKNQAESLDALSRAMVQLPSYLERVLAGGRDLALVLLPLLNDLRAVRGSPLLSEGTLLLLNLRSDETGALASPQPAAGAGGVQALPRAAALQPGSAPQAGAAVRPGESQQPGEALLTLPQWARRLRAQFQLGLVGWIRGERPAENLAALSQVAQKIQDVATQQPVFQLWWVTGAVVEALRDGGLESSVSVKRLLGLADRELKRLYEEGEARYCESPPVELLNNLLYYVARSTSTGPHIGAVRTSFRLDELLPVDQEIDEERDTLSAPSIKLMQTVAAAIREDLGKVKDTLDIFVRRGGGQPGELAPQLELLRKIGDTLGVLGLGELRENIQQELVRLADMIEGRVPVTEPALIQIASTLIGVEDHLDASLLRMIVPGQGAGANSALAVPRDSSGEPASEEFLQVQAAVLRECIVNLARIKETIAQNVAGTLDAASLDAWPELMRGIVAGLTLLGRGRAVQVVESIAYCLRRVMQPRGYGFGTSYLDRLADAIVSVEYYMETLQAGRAEPMYMLDNAQLCLDALQAAPDAVAPTVAPLAAASFARTVRLESATGMHAVPADFRATEVIDRDAAVTMLDPSRAAAPSAAQPAPSQPFPAAAESAPADERTRVIPRPELPVLAAAASDALAGEAGRRSPLRSTPLDEVDPELTLIFIEEAREEVARIAASFPEWERNPGDGATLQKLRRSFHTLKGSGRMVGAVELAEFAWAIENLMNRLQDGTLERSPAVAATLREAIAVTPVLVEQLAGGPAPESDVNALVARAHALAVNPDIVVPPVGGQTTLIAPAVFQPIDLLPSTQAPPPPAPQPTPLPAAGSGAPAMDESAALEFEPEREPEPEPETEAETEAAAEPQPETAPVTAAASPEALVEAIVAGDDSDATAAEFATATATATAPTAAALPVAASSAAPDAQPEDAALREIYLRETDNHVATLRGFMLDESWRPEPHRVTEAVYRACHTLSGSSKMAQARHGIRLAEPLDHWLRRAWNSGIGLGDGDLLLLADCMDAMQQVARRPDESTIFFADHAALYERIATAGADLERRIAAAAPARPHASIESEAEPEALPEAELEVVLEAQPEMQPPADAAEQSPSVAAQCEPVDAPPPPAHTAPLMTDAEVPDAGFDAEIAAIFTDEATELLEACEAALQSWSVGHDDLAAIAALKRPLHTLKGGARMSGVTAMGDLAHELETAIGHIELGIIAPDERALDALQAGLDELGRMRDRLAEGRNPAAVPAIIERLINLDTPAAHALAAPEVATPDELAAAPLDAAVAPSPELAHYEEAGIEVDTTGIVERIDLPSTLEPAWAAEAVDDEAGIVVTSWDDAADAALADEMEPAVPGTLAGPAGAVARLPAAMLAVPPGREPVPPGDRAEMARVDADLLDQLLTDAGEVSIGRARLEQQVGSIDHNLGELSRTVTRLKEQLRKLEIETEKQILHRYENEASYRGDFDPLELDRYSSIQQFSRALAETASDVGSIQQLLESLTHDTQNLLQQQARVVTELQNGLMRTRMVPFQRHVQRLSRIVRQAATDTGKRAELVIEGASGELDRQVLERMLPPFEHLLRNAVAHGIESPEQRNALGKPEAGRVSMSLRREGSEVVVEIADDGAGLDVAAIRAKGVALGLIDPARPLSDSDAMQLILEPGFSTAERVTQHAGRGVGMDVVATEVKKLGGALNMDSRAGVGTRFVIRLPFTLAISHALVVRVESEFYALPLPTVEGVVRLPRAEVERHLAQSSPSYEYSGQKYRLQQLALFVGLVPSPLPTQDVTIPVVLVRAGENSTGLVTDELVGSREIVVKSAGPQISAIRGISGATILGDGRIVVILDIGALVRADWRARLAPIAANDKTDSQPVALVVDDSITVRRVTQRLLERNGMRVLTARDGLDAMAVLADNLPDVILLDIEMPRMDGYEVAAQVRNEPRTAGIPIIMITSRVGDKHRARAIELGVDDYLGKPYQEAQLLEAIEPLVARRRAQLGRKPAAGSQASALAAAAALQQEAPHG
jgi:chemosensory pili system protein ChpA (sensor histidine kinase/response regulator)